MVDAPRVTVPVEPTEAMLDAARGLIMSLSFGVPNYKTSLSEVARADTTESFGRTSSPTTSGP